MSDFVVRNVDTEKYRKLRAALMEEGKTLGDWLREQMEESNEGMRAQTSNSGYRGKSVDVQQSQSVAREQADGSSATMDGAGMPDVLSGEGDGELEKPVSVSKARQDGKPCRHGLLYHPGCTG